MLHAIRNPFNLSKKLRLLYHQVSLTLEGSTYTYDSVTLDLIPCKDGLTTRQ